MKTTNPIPTRKDFTCLLIGLSVCAAATAPAASIDFNDGTSTQPIGAFYAAQGLTFQNASWVLPSPINVMGTPSQGLVLCDVTDNGFNPPFSPGPLTPIVGTFTTPQGLVSILAVDVGEAGARLNVYDAISGGNLIGSDTFFGVGAGVGMFDTLSVTVPGIMRFELFQPSQTVGDGLLFDNLAFSPVPEPGVLSLGALAVVLVVAGPLARRLRQGRASRAPGC